MLWRAAARRSLGCARGSLRRDWRWSTQGHQTEEARWRAGGASDRSDLLGASEGEEALECASSGQAFRGAGVRRRAHLPRVGPAHSEKSAIKPWLKGQWSIPPKQDASFLW